MNADDLSDVETTLAERGSRPPWLLFGVLLVAGAAVVVPRLTDSGPTGDDDGATLRPTTTVPSSDRDESRFEVEPPDERRDGDAPTVSSIEGDPLFVLPDGVPEPLRLLFTNGVGDERPFSEIDRLTLVRVVDDRFGVVHLWLDFDIPASPPWPDRVIDLGLDDRHEAFVSDGGDVFVSRLVSGGAPRINLRAAFPAGSLSDGEIGAFMSRVEADIAGIDASVFTAAGFVTVEDPNTGPSALFQGEFAGTTRQVVLRVWPDERTIPSDALGRSGAQTRTPNPNLEAYLGATGSVNRIGAFGFGGYVEIEGTVPTNVLLELATGLEEVSGAEFGSRPRQAAALRSGAASCPGGRPSAVEPLGGLIYEVYWGDMGRALPELERSDVDRVETYFDQGEQLERTALTVAVESGCLDRVEFLLDNGADPTRAANGVLPAQIATALGLDQIAERLTVD